MNWRFDFNKGAVTLWLLAGCVLVQCAVAAPPAPPAAPEPVKRSTFTMPASPKDGRDPFFPNSTRPYETAIAAVAQPRAGDMSSLVLKGISGPPDRRLAIINNHTLAIGDEETITTPQGPIHIRCVEIKGNSVVVESGGLQHELNYTKNR
jgi:hypothetical protein